MHRALLASLAAIVCCGAVVGFVPAAPTQTHSAPSTASDLALLETMPMRGAAERHAAPPPSTVLDPRTLAYGGNAQGVVTEHPQVYVVFWGSQWGTPTRDKHGILSFSGDPDHGAPYLQNFYRGLGTGGEQWSAILTQYCTGVPAGSTSCPHGATHVPYPRGGVLAGTWYDGAAAQPTAPTWQQLADEATRAAAHFGNTRAAQNQRSQYVILSPHATDPENYREGGFCAAHTGLQTAAGYVTFTIMPYVMDVGWGCGSGMVNSPGTLDGYAIVASHEYAETVTNMRYSMGWHNESSSAWHGEEIADECDWIFSGQGAMVDIHTDHGDFPINGVWSNDTQRCESAHPIVTKRG